MTTIAKPKLEPMVSTAKAAEALDLHVNDVYRLIKAGLLRGKRLEGLRGEKGAKARPRYRVYVSSLIQYQQNLPDAVETTSGMRAASAAPAADMVPPEKPRAKGRKSRVGGKGSWL